MSDDLWKEAKASYQPVARRSSVERRRGFAFLAAFAAAFVMFVAVMWICVQLNLDGVPRGLAAMLVLVTFWGVRRALRPRTIFEEEPRTPE